MGPQALEIRISFVLRTKRFGVNNRWWCDFDSMFGVSLHQMVWDAVCIYPLLRNYHWMKLRSQMAYTLHSDIMISLGWGKKRGKN